MSAILRLIRPKIHVTLDALKVVRLTLDAVRGGEVRSMVVVIQRYDGSLERIRTDEIHDKYAFGGMLNKVAQEVME